MLYFFNCIDLTIDYTENHFTDEKTEATFQWIRDAEKRHFLVYKTGQILSKFHRTIDTFTTTYWMDYIFVSSHYYISDHFS